MTPVQWIGVAEGGGGVFFALVLERDPALVAAIAQEPREFLEVRGLPGAAGRLKFGFKLHVDRIGHALREIAVGIGGAEIA